MFGGPGWTLDPERGRFYYHAYLREQPDLDWRNPELREAMLGVLRFWLDRGVDGFRVDALRQVLKDPELRDNPPNPDYRPGQPEYDQLLPVHSADHDDLAPVIAMAETIAERGGVMVGELYLPLERLARYYGAGRAHAVEHAPDLDAVGAARARRADRGVRARAARGRVAELGARQPRPLARGVARRAGAGARRGDAAAHAARHADALLRRRARDARRGDPARARAGPVGGGGPRPGAHADAVERGRRLHDRRAVAAVRRPRAQRRRRSGRTRARCSTCTAS